MVAMFSYELILFMWSVFLYYLEYLDRGAHSFEIEFSYDAYGA